MKKPRIHSIWNVTGTVYEFEVINFSFTGAGHNVSATMYELKYTHRRDSQWLTPERFDKLINDNKIQEK